MSPRRPPMILAPGASGSGSARAPGHGESLPAIDDRLATPEGHDEVIDGVRYRTMGANPPHATQHVEVAHIFRGTLAPGYRAAVDMLTRSKKETDAAPDVSVFPEGADPVTGGRRLEEIAFEVCDTEGDKHVTAKVRALAMRGVRRLFYIRVSDRAVHEWEHTTGAWTKLADDAVIDDRCFRVPIPVAALVDQVLADDTVARALLAAGNSVIVGAIEAGALRTLRESLLRVLARRGVSVDEATRARVMECADRATLETWLDQAATAEGAAEVFGGG